MELHKLLTIEEVANPRYTIKALSVNEKPFSAALAKRIAYVMNEAIIAQRVIGNTNYVGSYFIIQLFNDMCDVYGFHYDFDLVDYVGFDGNGYGVIAFNCRNKIVLLHIGAYRSYVKFKNKIITTKGGLRVTDKKPKRELTDREKNNIRDKSKSYYQRNCPYKKFSSEKLRYRTLTREFKKVKGTYKCL